jgi:hypothetical protein
MAALIELTDDAFKIAANAAVIAFIRRENPFAHSNVGTRLLRLGRATSGAERYCPDYHSYAYVVLHTRDKVIFALAYGMRHIALRLPAAAQAEAAADGGTPCPAIGEGWLSFDTKADAARLAHWCEQACRAAEGADGAQPQGAGLSPLP